MPTVGEGSRLTPLLPGNLAARMSVVVLPRPCQSQREQTGRWTRKQKKRRKRMVVVAVETVVVEVTEKCKVTALFKKKSIIISGL